MLKVFFGAVPLALGEDSEHQLDLTVKWGKLSCNLHDHLLLELLAID